MKLKIFHSILFLLAVADGGNCLFGQHNTLRFSNITTKQGLSDDQVQCFLEDSQGFIWIGTKHGLNCYDAISLKIFKHDAQTPGSISDNAINDIFEDSHKEIWVATSGGLDKFNRDKRTFHSYKYDKHNPNSLSNNDLTQIAEDNLGNLWIGSKYGLNVYLRKEDHFAHYFHQENDTNSLNHNDIYQILKDHSGNIWINTANGLNKFDPLKKQFIHVNERQTNLKLHFTYMVGALFDDSRNNLWYGTQSGLYLIDKKQNHTILYKKVLENYEFNNIRAIAEDYKHNLWIGTRNGLVRYNPINQSITMSKHQEYDEYSLTKNEIWKLMSDKQGLLWIGTFKGGVNILNTNKNSVGLYRHDPADAKSLDNSFVLSFLEDTDSDIWIGTDGGGLNKFDVKHNTFSSYIPNSSINTSISSNTVLSLVQDRQGTIWVGTWNGGICRFNKKTGAFKTYFFTHAQPGALSNPNVWAMLEDSKDNFWIGTMGGGLNKLDRKTGYFTNYMYDSANPDSSYTIDNNVWALKEDKKGNIWVGSSKCLNLFNPKTGHFKHFYQKEANSNNSREVEVLCISEDKKGRIWIGTEGDGLNKQTGDHMSVLGPNDGAPLTVIYGILEDNRGYLWLSSNNGIFRYDPDNKKSKSFDYTYGLQGNQFNQGSYMRTKEGQLYFGGPNGFNVFYPDSLKNNTYDPPVVLTDFQIFNKPVPIKSGGTLEKHINQTDVIKLSPRQSVFTIQFACLNYSDPEKNQYAYMLDDFDNTWNYVGTKHEATYTNLNPGEYVFKVRAANNDGIWGTKIKSIRIIIEPPIWKTIWFRILFIILVIVGLLGIYLRRVRSIRKKNEWLEKLVLQRTNELEIRSKEIEDKNQLLIKQTQTLNEINTLLEERQQRVEEQAEELRCQKEELQTHGDQLAQLNATKDKLFSILAHDLRNPFQAIIGFSELLKNDVHKLPKAKVDKFLDLIYTSSIRGNDLLNNILQWSRAQTGRILYEPAFLNLIEIVTESTSLMEADALQKGIHVEVKIDSNTIVYADKNMLQTILRNLISNALKFTYENGHILINSRSSNNLVEVSIADNGVGISKENKDKLFRIDQTITTQGTSRESGTGLGLILCKEFVERHKGKIWVNSELTKGTTFYFTLPSTPEIL